MQSGLLDKIVINVGERLWKRLEKGRGYTLLRLDFLRIGIVKWRKKYFIERVKSLRTWDAREGTAVKAAITHNLQGLHDIDGLRSLRIIRPLSVIETYRPLGIMPTLTGYDQDYLCDAKILDVGPRTEGELFTLMAYGFKKENITGLDLISYSPLIDVGDMHNMPYKDDTFEITIASCVLVYSDDPEAACREMVRVTKDGGLICISQDTVPNAGIAAVDKLGKQLLRIEDYLELFAPHVKRIFFQHELPERLKPVTGGELEGSNYTTGIIFSIKKTDVETPDVSPH